MPAPAKALLATAPASARRAQLAGDAGWLAEAATILAQRGVALANQASSLVPQAASATDASSASSAPGFAAIALASPVDANAALGYVAQCQASAASDGVPMVLFAPMPQGADQGATEQVAALALLRANAAIVTSDPDIWLEAVVLCARFVPAAGANVAVVAGRQSWLYAQLAGIETTGLPRHWRLAGNTAQTGQAPADIVLFDLATPPPTPHGDVLWVPVVPRGEQATPAPCLVGARAALGAVMLYGMACERLAIGLGPASAGASDELEIDRERMQRQLDRIDDQERRLGDHETKVLLAAYGVAITRQAVATTASAALRIAKRAGFPVEIKPWGNDIAPEREGCPVERNLQTGADVRRAYTAVLTAAGKASAEEDGAAVIVREAVPQGRELQATFVNLPQLGWTALVTGTGGAQPAAAPCPLRVVDANALAAQLLASRSDEALPDRIALANILRRTSHLVVDQQARIHKLHLHSVVIGTRGERTMVVDAATELAP